MSTCQRNWVPGKMAFLEKVENRHLLINIMRQFIIKGLSIKEHLMFLVQKESALTMTGSDTRWDSVNISLNMV